MKHILKSSLVAAAVASAVPVAAPAVHAFSPQDYVGWYLDTRTAYFIAQRGFAYAEAKFSFITGMLALYGETAFGDPYPAIETPLEPWCRYHDFRQGDRGPAYPEVTGYVNEFADGHSTHALLDYPADLHGGKTKSADLHFLTAEADDNAAVLLQQFVGLWPFASSAEKAATQDQAASDIAAAASGLEPWMNKLTADPNARTRLTPQYWFNYYYGTGPGLPDSYSSDYRFPLGVADSYFGELCASDTDCPAGVHCETDPDADRWTGSFPSVGDQRCHYIDQAVVFPPTPVAPSEDYLSVAFKGAGDFQWQYGGDGIPDAGRLYSDYRAARDEYFKWQNQLKLAKGPYEAARDSVVKLMTRYLGGVSTFFR